MDQTYKHPEKLLVSFLSKTLAILNNPLFEFIIGWDRSGRMIEIRNQMAFQEQILSKQFKHKNIKSFVRQLNMYGFRKVKKGITKNSFFHPYFRRDSKQQMKLIRRRKNCRLRVQQKFLLPQVKMQQNFNKTIQSEDTILSNKQDIILNNNILGQQPASIYQQFSVKDLLVQQQLPQYVQQINPWIYVQQDNFQNLHSFEYSFLDNNSFYS